MNNSGKKVLISASFGPDFPERAPAPFLFAAEAARMGAQVGICFVLQAPMLLKKGVAQGLVAKEGSRTIRAFIDEAVQAGVTLYVCDAALQLCNMAPEDLIEEVDHLVGPSFLIAEGLAANLVLSF